MGAQQRVVCLALAEFRFMSCSNLYALAGSCRARSSSVIVCHLVLKVCILHCFSNRFTFFTSIQAEGLQLYYCIFTFFRVPPTGLHSSHPIQAEGLKLSYCMCWPH